MLFNSRFDGGTEGSETGQADRVQGPQRCVNCVKKFTLYLVGNGGPE